MAKSILLQNNNNYKISEDINIILAPELYSVRIFDIPIESSSELKLVIPDFFEDFFDTEGYSFYHIKLEKHKYLCFAYKQDNILNILEKSNIEIKYVKNIYFLQNELSITNGTLYKYADIQYICTNDIIVKLPSNINIKDNTTDMDVDNINLSKHNIFLNKSSKYIDNKTSYIISFIFIIFALFNFYKMNDINSQRISYEEKLNNLKKQYHVPSSMIQTKSIINEYQTTKDKYLDFLNAFEYLLKYKKKVNSLLKSIEYKNNKIIVVFENKVKNKVKIENYIKRKYKISSSRIYNNNLNIEIKL